MFTSIQWFMNHGVQSQTDWSHEHSVHNLFYNPEQSSCAIGKWICTFSHFPCTKPENVGTVYSSCLAQVLDCQLIRLLVLWNSSVSSNVLNTSWWESFFLNLNCLWSLSVKYCWARYVLTSVIARMKENTLLSHLFVIQVDSILNPLFNPQPCLLALWSLTAPLD